MIISIAILYQKQTQMEIKVLHLAVCPEIGQGLDLQNRHGSGTKDGTLAIAGSGTNERDDRYDKAR